MGKIIFTKTYELDACPGKGEKMQDFIKRTLNILFENVLVPESEVENLRNPIYCNETFHIGNFALLQTERNADIEHQYWEETHYIFGIKYYYCAQWYNLDSKTHKRDAEIQQKKFSDWLKTLSNKSL